jgi:tRNA (cytidine/uridine-2'-O-)-methyltransferase
MLDVVLFQPEIPPNTGNIMRLCVNTGARLHLVAPLGFALDDAKLRRAGLDYGDWSDVTVHDDLREAIEALGTPRVLAFTTKGSHTITDFDFHLGDALLFGPETRGLPAEVLESIPGELRLRIPMRPNSRSLNLSNAVSVAVYEAWRQFGYPGAL